ncbi:MAG: hypothetical protein K2P12_01765 [Clostridia bacterium]|nr:hypothetical protein [Clostridia bacterium]
MKNKQEKAKKILNAQKNLRATTKRTLLGMETFINDNETVKLLDRFKNKFNICETIYKTVLRKYLANKEHKKEDEKKIKMNQVPAALRYAGYEFDRNLLNEIFGSESTKGQTIKILRNNITHGINKKDVEEIKRRKNELFEYMDNFIETIRNYD